MIRQWMQHRDYVFPGLGNFIQIEHRTAPHRPRDRTVLPHGITALHQIPFVYLAMSGPIIGMDASFEEAARTAGAPVSRMIASERMSDTRLL